jgi:hypothetical protein
MSLYIVPCTIGEAQQFISEYHRHHPNLQGALFAVAVASMDWKDTVYEDLPRGVATVGRPVSRSLDDGWTVEITRVAVLPNTPNACSMLYGACRRAAIALGYKRVVTYTLASEPGTSLRGAGFRVVADVRGETWNRPDRPRVDRSPLQNKLRWEGI